MASTGPVPLTTARGPLLIRARLSMHDDTDSDISPVYSDVDSYESDSDPGGETGTIASGATGLESSSAITARSLSMPVAKISGDEEYESLEEEEVESDYPSGAAKVLSTEKELNFVDRVSEDGSFQASDIPGTIEGDDTNGSSWAKTGLQDGNLKYEPVAESLGMQSYSLDRDKYEEDGESVMYDVSNPKENSLTIDNSENREARFGPESTVEGSSTHSVTLLEDFNSEKLGENTLFRVEDEDHKPVEGAEDADTRQYILSEDRWSGIVTADGIYFEESVDNESSITSVNFDEENLNESQGGDEIVEFDPSAMAALIRQATGAPADATIAIASAPDGTKFFSVERTQPADSNPGSPSTNAVNLEENQADTSLGAGCDDFVNLLTEEGKKVHEKVNSVLVKFVRLVNQLGLSFEDNRTASELLNRIIVAESLKLKTWLDEAKALEKAKREALSLDAAGNDLNFLCTILVLGKMGVGKSALINSIFKNDMSHTDAFDKGTDHIREIVGVVNGVVLRVVDTPGLSTSVMDQGANRKLLLSIKRHVKKYPPDVVLYVDRVDLQTRNFNDIPILTSITETLGKAVWLKVVRVLTHAGLEPPEGPSGAQLNYETYVAQQVNATQRAIHMATHDMSLSNAVALVDNHASCRTSQSGEHLLPNGIAWRPNLLLLCYSVKIMSEVYSVLKPDDLALSDAGFGLGMFRLPLQFFLSSLLRFRPHLKLSDGTVELDDDSEELSDLDLEREDEYDTLPPFKPLKKSEIEKLSREQKKIYFEEYAYRVKMFDKKQRKEAVRRSKEVERNMPDAGVGDLGEQGARKSVHINDFAMPDSFDGDCPSYRYRSLEDGNSWLQVRAVSDAQVWDHDCGLNGVLVDHSAVIEGRFPTSTWVQLKKNKDEFMIHLDSSICTRHGKAESTLTGLEIQKFGNCMAYILHGEARLNNLLRNSTTGGISIAFSGETVSTGLKIANHARISKQVRLTGTTGMVHAKDGTIYGCDLEAQIRSRDYPIDKCQSSIELNLVKLKEVLSIGASFKTEFEISSGSKLSVNLGVDGKRNGHVSVHVKSSDHIHIAILGLISLGVAIFNRFRSDSSNASTGSKILQ